VSHAAASRSYLSVTVRENRAADADQQDFLNSFIAADLDLVAGSLAAVDPGAGLAAYLTPGGAVDTGARNDLRRQPEVALDRVAPQKTPVGRWPADPRHPLALSQQFAVNTISGELGDSAGLFAVNGPPGTGMTTMLRDCFADNIVRRAIHLADLRLPSQAFVADTTYTWKNAKYGRTVRPLIPQLTGFEMVVASANNGEVENISTEIPARSALGPQWREEADYFAEQATHLLAASPSWGSVAARLGSKKNRIEFVNRFWNGKEKATDTSPRPTRVAMRWAVRGPPGRLATASSASPWPRNRTTSASRQGVAGGTDAGTGCARPVFYPTSRHAERMARGSRDLLRRCSCQPDGEEYRRVRLGGQAVPSVGDGDDVALAEWPCAVGGAECHPAGQAGEGGGARRLVFGEFGTGRERDQGDAESREGDDGPGRSPGASGVR
jgi:hypothetical protein